MTLTNLAIITILRLTNVSEVDNRTCQYFLASGGCSVHSFTNTQCAASATEKRVAETVIERVTVEWPHENPMLWEPVDPSATGIVDMRAARRRVTQDREVDRTVRIYRRSMHWTLQLVEPSSLVTTNTVPKP